MNFMNFRHFMNFMNFYLFPLLFFEIQGKLLSFVFNLFIFDTVFPNVLIN